MEHGTIFLDVLTVSNRLRHLDAAKVASIAASMDEIGLQQPVSVWVVNDGEAVELVAGAHRVEAAKKLGWEKIDCVFVDMDSHDRQLWQIDENLIRSDLTDLQRAQHTAKRAEVVKQRAELRSETDFNSDKSKKRGPKDKGQGKFVADTAAATGRSKTQVKVDKARGEKIVEDVQKDIEGTPIADSGVQLDALAAADPEDQREAVKAVNLGEVKDVREVLPEAKGKRGKSRRTKEEIHLVEFDRVIRFISTTCEALLKINIPKLDSKRRSQAITDLRNAKKHIEELIQTIQHAEEVEETEPARLNRSRPRDR